MNNTALLKIEQRTISELKQALQVQKVALSQLPAKLIKRLWVSPEEFLVVTSAPILAQWALRLSGVWRPSLPEPTGRRGPKTVYVDWSVMVVALTLERLNLGLQSPYLAVSLVSTAPYVSGHAS